MYQQIKLVLKSIVPESILFGLEPLMRKVYALPFKGDKYQCSICEANLGKWIPQPQHDDRLCPSCGSIARTRMLSWVLDHQLKLKNQSWSVLHFSPSRSLKRRLRQYSNLNYLTTDYESQYEDRNYDITAIPEEDNSFDLIICFHVLEHIPDDRLAMQELLRLVKPGGVVLLQTPFQDGVTYEDATITSEADREKHFGQKDHVRIYGFDDFIKRLKQVGFKTERRSTKEMLDSKELERYAMKASHVIVLGSK